MMFAQLDTSGLLDGGPVWGLVGILITLIWLLIKMILSEKDKRIQDAKENRDTLAQPLSYIRDSLSLIEKKIKVSKGDE